MQSFFEIALQDVYSIVQALLDMSASVQAQAVLSEALRISAEVKDWMLQSDIWKGECRH